MTLLRNAMRAYWCHANICMSFWCLYVCLFSAYVTQRTHGYLYGNFLSGTTLLMMTTRTILDTTADESKNTNLATGKRIIKNMEFRSVVISLTDLRFWEWTNHWLFFRSLISVATGREMCVCVFLSSLKFIFLHLLFTFVFQFLLDVCLFFFRGKT